MDRLRGRQDRSDQRTRLGHGPVTVPPVRYEMVSWSYNRGNAPFGGGLAVTAVVVPTSVMTVAVVSVISVAPFPGVTRASSVVTP